MQKLEQTIPLAVPLHDAFEFVDDVSNLPVWVPGMMEISDKQGPRKELRYRYAYKMAGIPLRGDADTLEYVPDQRIVRRSKGAVESRWTYDLKPIDDTHTELHLQIEYTVPVAVIGPIAEHTIAAMTRHEFELGGKQLQTAVAARN